MKLYSSLASWWPLLSSPAEYADEVEKYWRLLSDHAVRPIETLLELGCGGGNSAVHLKRKCQLTLTDVSPHMLDVSRSLNPECEHVEGDMRTLRLDGLFDGVFVQDAIQYMLTERELRQAITTAFEHCASGGVALFVPDYTAETWRACTEHGGHDGEGRSLRYLQWDWDPDPADTEYVADMVYVLREGEDPPHVEYERHRLGLFSRSTWIRLLEEVGFRASAEACQGTPDETRTVFVGVKARDSVAREPINARSA